MIDIQFIECNHTHEIVRNQEQKVLALAFASAYSSLHRNAPGIEMITTTLKRIRAHSPCANGWAKLLAHLGKTCADDEPLPFTVILDSNGLDDALWCCRAEPQHDSSWRRFAVDCADSVAHLMTDERSLTAIRVARLHADGNATDEELHAAGAAAWAAAWAAAGDAAWAAARAAAGDAAWAAARDAAWDAAGAAAGAAARDAARTDFAENFRQIVSHT